MVVADDLKRKRAEVCTEIEVLRPQLETLEPELAAFNVFIDRDDPKYSSNLALRKANLCQKRIRTPRSQRC